MSEQILKKVTRADGHFHRLRYVLRALPKNSIRYYLNYLFVDGKDRLVGCDGHRLHVAKSSNLAPGFYEVLKNTKSEIWLATAPDVDDKYPEFEKHILSTQPKAKKHWITCSPIHPDQATFHVFSHFQVCINTGYIRDALCSDFGSLRVACKDSVSPVFFKYDSGDVLGVVMPIKAGTVRQAA